MRFTPPRRASRRMAGLVIPCNVRTTQRVRGDAIGRRLGLCVTKARQHLEQDGADVQVHMQGSRRVQADRVHGTGTGAHLDVVAQDLAVALGTALAQALATFAASRHVGCLAAGLCA